MPAGLDEGEGGAIGILGGDQAERKGKWVRFFSEGGGVLSPSFPLHVSLDKC